MPLKRSSLTAVALAMPTLLCGGCRRDAPTTTSKQVATTAAEADAPGTPAAAPVGAAEGLSEPLLAWLDPDAAAAAYVATPPDLDPAALGDLVAAPPDVERLLRRATAASGELRDCLDPAPGAPLPFEPGRLASLSAIGRELAVIRSARTAGTELRRLLTNGGFSTVETAGFEVFRAGGPCPWQVVLLSSPQAPRPLVALVEAATPGTGVAPLAAARDLPPSDLARNLSKALDERPRPWIEVAAGGPLLHLDLPGPIAGYHLTVRPSDMDRIDLQAEIVPMEGDDPANLQRALSSRDLVGMEETTAALARKTAYTADERVVRARLAVPRKALRRAGAPP